MDLDVSQISWKKEAEYDEYLDIIITKKNQLLFYPSPNNSVNKM
jgi:hypothetical protein